MTPSASEARAVTASEAHAIKKAPGVEGVLPLFLDRWSPRSFADRAVEPAQLAKVFEAARWAASSSNEQPWRFLIGTRPSETWQKIFDTLVDGNKKWVQKVPVLILGVANTRNSRGAENRFALYDTGAAAAYLTLQAAYMGLAAHQMGGYDREKARATFGIPEEFIPTSVIALGYQDEPAALADENQLTQETSPRNRKPLSEFVYSAWGEPANLG
jgi:nitroreductase